MSAPSRNAPRAENTALPSSWYRSPAIYEIERRAIFSKHWLFVAHKNRFQKAGDYVKYEIAGFSFFLMMDRQGNIGGFHNVCRHRAYPVIRPENPDSGTKLVLACYYHGWSYGLNGKLAKAPGFQDVENFKKEENGLFPVHVKVDARGFIWVNLEASETPSVSWDSMYKGSDTRDRLSQFKMDDYVYDHSWSINGDYNWKASLDNYNECYHCPTTHPLFVENCDLKKYRVDVEGGEILHFVKDKPGKSTNSYAPSSFFPNTAVSITKDYWYHMSVCPTGPTTAIMKYDVYRHKDASDEAFIAMDKFFKQVEDEDKMLCNGAQLNLNLGTYAAGELQPEQEKGVLHFQNLVRQAVMEHRQKEDELKDEIWPARQNPMSNDDVKFCSSLEGCSAKQVPAW